MIFQPLTVFPSYFSIADFFALADFWDAALFIASLCEKAQC